LRGIVSPIIGRRGSAARRRALRCGFAVHALDFILRQGRQEEIAVRAKRVTQTAVALAACTVIGIAAGVSADRAQSFAVAPRNLPVATTRPPLRLVQNSFSPFTLPQMAEPAVSPINPGTLPGTTAAIGGSATGTNPITGLPCNGAGSLAISGAGGLPGTATPPPQDSTETLGQIPVGTPPTTSIFGSQSNLGSC
jgi:hypothetical protein